jgi:hypothetical protein
LLLPTLPKMWVSCLQSWAPLILHQSFQVN